jgi:DNA-binding response OmpR family regulator
VIVLDRHLPAVHGDTLCRMITDDDDPAMILMLTAANAPTERVAGLALGVASTVKATSSTNTNCG